MGGRFGGISLAVALFLLLPSILATAAPTPIAVRTLMPHAPILIDSDANFTATNGVTTGNGSAGNPYIIEGWDINAANGDGVFLRSTTSHVILRNLSVHDGGPTYVGILILYASNVTIQHVNATSSAQGIYVARAADVTVSASNGSTAQGGGVGVTKSPRVLMDDNDGWFSEFGIWVNGSSSVAVSNNRLHRNWRGVFVTNSPSVSISRNDVEDNDAGGPGPTMGIGVGWSNGAALSGNVISSVAQAGISIEQSTNISLESNRVTQSGVGAQLTASAGLIYGNRFYFNTVQSIDDTANVWDGGTRSAGTTGRITTESTIAGGRHRTIVRPRTASEIR